MKPLTENALKTGQTITIDGLYAVNPEPQSVTVDVTIEAVEHHDDRTVITLTEESAARLRTAIAEAEK